MKTKLQEAKTMWIMILETIIGIALAMLADN